jgi:hypothetical protein
MFFKLKMSKGIKFVFQDSNGSLRRKFEKIGPRSKNEELFVKLGIFFLDTKDLKIYLRDLSDCDDISSVYCSEYNAVILAKSEQEALELDKRDKKKTKKRFRNDGR